MHHSITMKDQESTKYLSSDSPSTLRKRQPSSSRHDNTDVIVRTTQPQRDRLEEVRCIHNCSSQQTDLTSLSTWLYTTWLYTTWLYTTWLYTTWCDDYVIRAMYRLGQDIGVCDPSNFLITQFLHQGGQIWHLNLGQIGPKWDKSGTF